MAWVRNLAWHRILVRKKTQNPTGVDSGTPDPWLPLLHACPLSWCEPWHCVTSVTSTSTNSWATVCTSATSRHICSHSGWNGDTRQPGPTTMDGSTVSLQAGAVCRQHTRPFCSVEVRQIIVGCTSWIWCEFRSCSMTSCFTHSLYWSYSSKEAVFGIH